MDGEDILKSHNWSNRSQLSYQPSFNRFEKSEYMTDFYGNYSDLMNRIYINGYVHTVDFPVMRPFLSNPISQLRLSRFCDIFRSKGGGRKPHHQT